MSVRQPANLSYLIIYNATLQPEDTIDPDDEDADERAHILFYTCKEREVDHDRMLRQVGLAEALVNFCEMMSGTSSQCESVHSQTSRRVMISPETNYWIHACIDVGKTPQPMDIKGKGKGKEREVEPKATPTFDYHENALDDAALRAQLLHAYQWFKLQYGGFESILSRHGRQHLRNRMDRFFTSWAWNWDIEESSQLDSEFVGITTHPRSDQISSIISTSSWNDSETPFVILDSPYLYRQDPSASDTSHNPKRHNYTHHPALTSFLTTLTPSKPKTRGGRRKAKNLGQKDAKESLSPSDGHPSQTLQSKSSTLGFAMPSMPSMHMNLNVNLNMRSWSWGAGLFKSASNGHPPETKPEPEEDTQKADEGSTPATDPSNGSPADDAVAVEGEADAAHDSQDSASDAPPTEDERGTQTGADGHMSTSQMTIMPRNSLPQESSKESLDPSGLPDETLHGSKLDPVSNGEASEPAVKSDVHEASGIPPAQSGNSTPSVLQSDVSSVLESEITHEWSCAKVFLPTGSDSTQDTERRIWCISSSGLLFAILPRSNISHAEMIDEHVPEDECPAKSVDSAVQLLSLVREALDSYESETRTKTGPTLTKRAVLGDGQYTANSPMSTTSNMLLHSRRLLRHMNILEVISRPTPSSLPWFAVRRSQGPEGENIEETYLELHKADATLVDVDRDLSSTSSSTGLR
ncbi:hypothetical protein SISNIDRAFT_453442 [Sistotremastrum niveocremeum HHB9708]|uniref:CCZ1/INTU/HSP4 first Longin domain-containing protein n=1 Tax=Sistotremastrum niveocremeum HHB9708 TaxID=1314777 RepID=A0A164VVR8_9AGAM|nr:hypothetical protein SISNIDRAFT_453442 [Sistotremastrum niveocremeum HHB9708]